MDSLKNAAIIINAEAVGSVLPNSHFDTAFCVYPMDFAKSVWVIFLSVRSSFNLSENLIALLYKDIS